MELLQQITAKTFQLILKMADSPHRKFAKLPVIMRGTKCVGIIYGGVLIQFPMLADTDGRIVPRNAEWIEVGTLNVLCLVLFDL